LLGGAGVGLTIPSLLGAGSASLTPDRFGTGSGILNMARQVGTVLGVAGLVAILTRVTPADAIAEYRDAVLLIIGFFGVAGVVAAALLGGRAGAARGAGSGSGSGSGSGGASVSQDHSDEMSAYAPRALSVGWGVAATPAGS
jgi:hypothetical protein